MFNTWELNKNFFFNIFSRKDLLFRKSIPAEIILKLNNLKNKNKIAYIPLLILIIYYALVSFFIFFEFKNLKSRLYFAIRDKALNKFINMFDYHFSLSEDLSKCIKTNFSDIDIHTLHPIVANDYLEKIEHTNNNMILSFLSKSYN